MPQRRACRTRRLPARPARTTRCGRGRCTRRRRGSSRRVPRAAGAGRTGPGRRRRDRRRGRGSGRVRPRRRAPLGPPTITSVTSGSSSAASDSIARPRSFNGWMRPRTASTRCAVEAELRACGIASRRARTRCGRHRAGRSRCVRDRRRTAKRVARVRLRSTRASCRRTRSRRARCARAVRDRRRCRRRPSRERACGTSPTSGRSSACFSWCATAPESQ